MYHIQGMAGFWDGLKEALAGKSPIGPTVNTDHFEEIHRSPGPSYLDSEIRYALSYINKGISDAQISNSITRPISQGYQFAGFNRLYTDLSYQQLIGKPILNRSLMIRDLVRIRNYLVQRLFYG